MCIHAHGCAWVWRPEVNLRHGSSSAVDLFVLRQGLSWPGALALASKPQESPFQPLQLWDCKYAHLTLLSGAFWGIEPRSSRLHASTLLPNPSPEFYFRFWVGRPDLLCATPLLLSQVPVGGHLGWTLSAVSFCCILRAVVTHCERRRHSG